ncbi:MAG: acyloxyacyl hydrolase [Syntrophobacterales bacterium]|nr:acyloxyacyl hydrolase [Syntrophobacterales bacterium]
MVRRICASGLVFLALAAFVLLPGFGKAAEFDVSKFNYDVGVLFAYGKNTHGANVQLYSLMPHWGKVFIPPGKQMGPFALSGIIEGVISIASAEETGFELGFTPMLKLSCLVFPSVLAHIEGGAGLITESIDSPALAHAFNFTPQVGGGVDIALTSQLALTVAYRFRHSSNAGIYNENPAFNVNFFQGGLNYYY